MRTFIVVSLLFMGCAATPLRPPLPRYPPPQGRLQRGMQNCPSALVGATTRVTNAKDGVDLEITASDRVVQQQIVELAVVHEHLGSPNRSEKAHSGMHGGPGTIGYCPIIHVGTKVTSRRRSDGAVIHIHALRPEDVPDLQIAVADRVAQFANR